MDSMFIERNKYIHQEYPKWISVRGESFIVSSEEEEKAHSMNSLDLEKSYEDESSPKRGRPPFRKSE